MFWIIIILIALLSALFAMIFLLPNKKSNERVVYVVRAIPDQNENDRSQPARKDENAAYSRFTEFIYEFDKSSISDQQIYLYWACFTGRIEDVQANLSCETKLNPYCVAIACYQENTVLLKWLLADKQCDYDERITDYLCQDRKWNDKILDARTALDRFAEIFRYLHHNGGLRKYDDKNHFYNFQSLLEATIASINDKPAKPVVRSLDPFIVSN